MDFPGMARPREVTGIEWGVWPGVPKEINIVFDALFDRGGFLRRLVF